MLYLNNKENIEPLPATKDRVEHPLQSLPHQKRYAGENEKIDNALSQNNINANTSTKDIDFSAPKISYAPTSKGTAGHRHRGSDGEMTALKSIASFKLNKRRKNINKSKAPPPSPAHKGRGAVLPERPSVSDDDDEEKTPTSDPAFKEKTWLEKLFDYYDSTDISAGFYSGAANRCAPEEEEGKKGDVLTEANGDADKELLNEEHFIDAEYDF